MVFREMLVHVICIVVVVIVAHKGMDLPQRWVVLLLIAQVES